MSKFWCCPSCGSILEKHSDKEALLLEAGVEVVGHVICGKCGAKFARQDIYGGKYDVSPENPPDLIVIMCDQSIENLDTFIDSFFHTIPFSLGPTTSVSVQQDEDAKVLDKIFVKVITYALLSLRRRSLDLDDNRVKYRQFEIEHKSKKISGHVFSLYSRK